MFADIFFRVAVIKYFVHVYTVLVANYLNTFISYFDFKKLMSENKKTQSKFMSIICCNNHVNNKGTGGIHVCPCALICLSDSFMHPASLDIFHIFLKYFSPFKKSSRYHSFPKKLPGQLTQLSFSEIKHSTKRTLSHKYVKFHVSKIA